MSLSSNSTKELKTLLNEYNVLDSHIKSLNKQIKDLREKRKKLTTRITELLKSDEKFQHGVKLNDKSITLKQISRSKSLSLKTLQEELRRSLEENIDNNDNSVTTTRSKIKKVLDEVTSSLSKNKVEIETLSITKL